MLRRIDFYLLTYVLRYLVLVGGALWGLWMGGQLYQELNALWDAQVGLGDAAVYYMWRLPEYAVRFLPLAFFAALLLGLVELSKSNQILALRACGLRYGRLFRSLWGAATLVGLGLWGIEYKMMPWTQAYVKAQQTEWKMPDGGAKKTFFCTLNQPQPQWWVAGQLNVPERRASQVHVSQSFPTLSEAEDAGHPVLESVYASNAWFDGQQWHFYQGFRQTTFNSAAHPAPPEPFVEYTHAAYRLPPEVWAYASEPPQTLSPGHSSKLLPWLQGHEMAWTYRFYQTWKILLPFGTVIGAFLATRFSLWPARQGLWKGPLWASVLFATYWGLLKLGQGWGLAHHLDWGWIWGATGLLVLGASEWIYRRQL